MEGSWGRVWGCSAVVVTLVIQGCGTDCVRCEAESDGGVARDAPASAPFTASNVTDCQRRGIQIGGAARAARVSPPRWPARVERVRYVFGATIPGTGVTCDHSIPFEVLLFTGLEPRPPAEPDVLRRIRVDGPAGGDEAQSATLELDEPLAIPTGEYLFIVFSLPGGDGSGRWQCLSFCDVGSDPGDFSSNVAPPYFWTETTLEGNGTKLIVEVDGVVL